MAVGLFKHGAEIVLMDAFQWRYNASMRHLAVYGSVKLIRDMCPECERNAFVIDGRFACCGLEVDEQPLPTKIKRMMEADGKRNTPPLSLRRIVLHAQSGLCFYCFRWLGGFVQYRGKAVRLRTEWDHLVPYAYLQNNPPANFVAACHICNRIKSSFMFQTIEDARVYIATKIEEKNRLYESKLPKDV